jgi:hypothetical protein
VARLSAPPAKTLLLNWVYFPPVGHLVEAMKVAKGYRDANPGLEVHVALNSQTPHELTAGCPWITRAHTVDLAEVLARGDQAPSLRRIPPEWDYVVVDERIGSSPFAYAPALHVFHTVAAGYFRARIWGGRRSCPPADGAPLYRRDPAVALRLPRAARRFAARYRHPGPRFGLLLAGSSPEPIYPPHRWWLRLLSALRAELPGSRFYITGAHDGEGGRTTTPGDPREIARRFGRLADVEFCYDIGLWNQLALLAACDVLISPHSGFAFLAPCVGTPWLALSGVRWPESVFNRKPFYCVLPECAQYPCYFQMKPDCRRRLGRGATVQCMETRALSAKIPEVLAGVRLLLDRGFTYRRAAALYRRQVAASRIARERLFALDAAVTVAGGRGGALV